MTWNWSWRLWGRGEGEVSESGNELSRAGGSEPRGAHEWEARLLQEGVSEPLASRLANSLESAHVESGRGSAGALIRGVTLAARAQTDQQLDVERNLREVREVERLLGAFSGELEKLDEVLEVLAAYAQRMRTKPTKASRRTLH